MSAIPLSIVSRAVLAGALLALPAGAGAQRYWPAPVQRVVAEHWRLVPVDSVSLATLARASKEVGGDTVVQAVIDVAKSPERPIEVRLEALSLLADAVAPGRSVPRFLLTRMAGGPGPDCEPSATWTAGDTLRVCADARRISPTRTIPADTRLRSSIDPPMRDAVRATLGMLAGSDPDPRFQRAASLLLRVVGPADTSPSGGQEQTPPPGTRPDHGP